MIKIGLECHVVIGLDDQFSLIEMIEVIGNRSGNADELSIKLTLESKLAGNGRDRRRKVLFRWTKACRFENWAVVAGCGKTYNFDLVTFPKRGSILALGVETAGAVGHIDTPLRKPCSDRADNLDPVHVRKIGRKATDVCNWDHRRREGIFGRSLEDQQIVERRCEEMKRNELIPAVERSSADSAETDLGINKMDRKGTPIVRDPDLENSCWRRNKIG